MPPQTQEHQSFLLQGDRIQALEIENKQYEDKVQRLQQQINFLQEEKERLTSEKIALQARLSHEMKESMRQNKEQFDAQLSEHTATISKLKSQIDLMRQSEKTPDTKNLNRKLKSLEQQLQVEQVDS